MNTENSAVILIKQLFAEQNKRLSVIESKIEKQSDQLLNPDTGLYARTVKNSEDISQLRVKLEQVDTAEIQRLSSLSNNVKKYLGLMVGAMLTAVGSLLAKTIF